MTFYKVIESWDGSNAVYIVIDYDFDPVATFDNIECATEYAQIKDTQAICDGLHEKLFVPNFAE